MHTAVHRRQRTTPVGPTSESSASCAEARQIAAPMSLCVMLGGARTRVPAYCGRARRMRCVCLRMQCVCGMSTSARSQFVRAAEIVDSGVSLCSRIPCVLCVDVLLCMRSVYLLAQGLVVRCSKIPHCNVVSRVSLCLPSSLAKRFVSTRMTRAPMSMNM